MDSNVYNLPSAIVICHFLIELQALSYIVIIGKCEAIYFFFKQVLKTIFRLWYLIILLFNLSNAFGKYGYYMHTGQYSVLRSIVVGAIIIHEFMRVLS